MKLIRCAIYSAVFSALLQAQGVAEKKKLYLIHGQGSDTREFCRMHFDTNVDTVLIMLPLPEKREDLHRYAARVSATIDTSSPFILAGVSLGGMVASEMADMLHPEKVILISSAKCRGELPARYRFMKFIPLYALFPACLIKAGSFIAQPLVEPDRKNDKELFVSMLRAKNPKFLKRTIRMIVRWDKKTYSPKIVHIHGTHDHTLPLRKVKAHHTVEHGSHMMAVTRAGELSEIIGLTIK